MKANNDYNMQIFQSTLPRGSDRAHSARRAPLPHFNPRSLAGATLGDYPGTQT